MKNYIENLSTTVLSLIHDEYKMWENEGSLPEISLIRSHVALCNLAREDALMYTMFAQVCDHILVDRLLEERYSK